MSNKRELQLAYLLTEAVEQLMNEDAMAGAAQPATAPAMGSPAPAPAPAAPQTPSAPAPAGSTGDGQQVFTVDELIDRLNIIRGGKSFSDPEVYKSLSAFFNALPQTDKETLDRTLTGLSKSVVNAPAEDQIPAPGTGTGMPPAPPAQQASAPAAPATAAPIGAAV